MDPPLGPKRSGHRHKPQQKASEGKSSTYRALVVTCFCIAEWSLYLYLPKKSKARDCSIERPYCHKSRDLSPTQWEKTAFSTIPDFSLFSTRQVNYFFLVDIIFNLGEICIFTSYAFIHLHIWFIHYWKGENSKFFSK